LTIHLYPLIGTYHHETHPDAATLLNDTWLDVAKVAAARVRAIVPAELPVWVGEGNPDWKVPPLLRHSLLFELANLDMTASLAAAGMHVFCRQTIDALLSVESESSAYWLALLWKRLMGEVARSTLVEPPASPIRAYAHQDPATRRVGVLLLNTGGDNATVVVVPPPSSPSDGAACTSQTAFEVRATNAGEAANNILINGEQPRFADRQHPTLPRCLVDAPSTPCGELVRVSARALTFVALELDGQ
jgi:hypothetical protein